MPAALREAAEALEQRLRVLSAPRSSLEVAAWGEYEARFPSVVPSWYTEFLRDFAFMGVYLVVPTSTYEGKPWAMFSFRSPREDAFCVEDDEEIIPHGWFPFAEEADGNLWAMRSNAAVDSPIILINHSAGGIESDRGVAYAAHCLAHLLSAAAISNGRYEHLTPDGFVDLSRSGFKLWGDHDAYMERHDIQTASELLERTMRSSEPPPSLSL
jgi:hypothetical protein